MRFFLVCKVVLVINFVFFVYFLWIFSYYVNNWCVVFLVGFVIRYWDIICGVCIVLSFCCYDIDENKSFVDICGKKYNIRRLYWFFLGFFKIVYVLK